MKRNWVAWARDERARAALGLPPFVRAVHGQIGGAVYKTYGSRIVVTRGPRMAGVVASQAQHTQRESCIERKTLRGEEVDRRIHHPRQEIERPQAAKDRATLAGWRGDGT